MPGYSRRMDADQARLITKTARELAGEDNRQSLGRRREDLFVKTESIVNNKILPKIEHAAKCGNPYTSVLFGHDEVASAVCEKLTDLGYQTHYFRVVGSKQCVVLIMW